MNQRACTAHPKVENGTYNLILSHLSPAGELAPTELLLPRLLVKTLAEGYKYKSIETPSSVVNNDRTGQETFLFTLNKLIFIANVALTISQRLLRSRGFAMCTKSESK